MDNLDHGCWPGTYSPPQEDHTTGRMVSHNETIDQRIPRLERYMQAVYTVMEIVTNSPTADNPPAANNPFPADSPLLAQLDGAAGDGYPTSDAVIRYPNNPRYLPNTQVFIQPRPLPLQPIHQARVARGLQPWVREEGTRRQPQEGPQHPISMLERAGTFGGDGQPMLGVSPQGQIRLRTDFWGTMMRRQRVRWNWRLGRQQLKGETVQSALTNHINGYLPERQGFIERQVARIRGGRGGRPADW